VPSALPSGDPAPPDGRLPSHAVEMARAAPFGAYVHVPFCETRCGYCDFNTYTAVELGGRVSRGSYADTLLAEVRLAAGVLGEMPSISTIFFGGGTPTLLPAEHLGLVIRGLRDQFGLAGDVEITTEANPETVTAGYFTRLREAGFTRVSIGMQSAVPHVLEVLDRRHRPGRPEAAVREARAAGFEHVNLDLIYGAPYESDDDWQVSLDAAITAQPDHISAYALVVEDGTALARQVAAGVVPAPDDDVLADRYVMADEALAAAGYDWYEISNWAASGAGRCRHNELYWSDSSWWGFGPGAHSHVGGVRWWNVKHPARYAALLDAGMSPAAGRETLDDDARITERLMLALRTRTGLPVDDIPWAARDRLPELASWGLIDYEDAVVLTQRGRLMADAVVKELLVVL
jgi:putative oxygen-independent coproporphyrinogen III oxidase